jgi:hypothetical protein
MLMRRPTPMASTPAQEEFLAITRKSQEAVITAIKSWVETVKTTTPRLASVYAPFADRLPKLPTFGAPFADRLPRPEEAVASAYHLAEQLLASQRRFAEDLLKAMTPLIPGHTESAAASPAAPSVPAGTAATDPAPKTATTASAAKSTAPRSTAPRSTAAKSTPAKGTPAKGTPAKSTPARNAATGTATKRAVAQSSPRSTTDHPAPEGPTAS